jgi:hypothetical protein
VASTITNFSNAINVNYPIPGQDNDSQGFRTNFSKVQSALTVAGGEITELQRNSVTLGGLNDFGNNVLKKPALQASSIVVSDGGSVTPDAHNVDFAQGNYHRYTLSSTGTYTFTIINWPPADKCGIVRLELTPGASVTPTVNLGGVNSSISRTSTNPITYNTQDPIVWDIWSPDEGVTVIADEVGSRGINVSDTGNIYPTKTPSTTMTDGFFYIPAGTGAPTGVPTAVAGFVPMYYDTTNNRFYVYNGAWKYGNLT